MFIHMVVSLVVYGKLQQEVAVRSHALQISEYTAKMLIPDVAAVGVVPGSHEPGGYIIQMVVLNPAPADAFHSWWKAVAEAIVLQVDVSVNEVNHVRSMSLV